MSTVARKLPLSMQQTALYERAAELGWAVRREPADRARNERMLFTRPGRSLMAVFSHDGAFAYARASGQGTGIVELDLPATLRELQKNTSPATASTSGRPAGQTPAAPAAPAVPPEETPPGEGSTTEGISVPEPPELRRAWGPWPLVVIGLIVLCVIVFMVARIIA
ncbi:DUF6480 family protein [Kitasatospora sp. NPDC051914]|uniref:DUF6480 family protein n=1 Tax=Kitasatospora sp. NPDC051914 TaxID=3154945 RepID=UPI00343363A1